MSDDTESQDAATPTWARSIAEIPPFVVQIKSNAGSGTGFKIGASQDGDWLIATAWHVIHNGRGELCTNLQLSRVTAAPTISAHGMRVAHSVPVEITESDVWGNKEFDLSFFAVPRQLLAFPAKGPAVIPWDGYVKIGCPICWCGVPHCTGADQLIFFWGRIGGQLSFRNASYFADGSAPPGVSGGPVWFIQNGLPVVFGLVSAYYPGKGPRPGEDLPGVAYVCGIQPIVGGITGFREKGPSGAQR